MTTGVKTSEFWLSLVAMIYNLILSTGIVPHCNEITAAINGVCALLVALGYTWARSFIKVKK